MPYDDDHLMDALDQDEERELTGPEDNLKICKHCRHGGLHWEEDNGRFRLVHPSGKIHSCRSKPITEL